MSSTKFIKHNYRQLGNTKTVYCYTCKHSGIKADGIMPVGGTHPIHLQTSFDERLPEHYQTIPIRLENLFKKKEHELEVIDVF